jgi:hypothetical protein
MKRIVLPGSGTPKTLTVAEDSTVGVLTNGRLITVNLTANVPTRIEFVNSLRNTGIAA